MLFFDQKLREEAYNWHGYKPDWNNKNITEGDIGMIAQLAHRIADYRSCSESEGFTWQESEIADLLTMVWRAGYRSCADSIKERVLPDLRGIINSFDR